MNVITAEKIKYIADCALADCACNTLKYAKEQIELRTKVFSGYESQWDEINLPGVLAAFEKILSCSRKSVFLSSCEILSDAMASHIAAERFKNRVAHTIKIANRDHGVWVTAEQVTAAAAGNSLFNFTKVAKMLAEKAQEAE